MIGHKAVVGLSLLTALAFCAFAAQSAVGASAINTTWVTCVKGGTKDFSDAHCDKKVEAGKGEYGHESIVGSTELHVTGDNTKNNTTESTPAILKGTIAGVKIEITCKVVTGSGTLENTEPSANWHFPKLLQWLDTWTGCSVNKPAGFGCKVKEPIESKLTGEGVEGLGAGKNEMGLEFKPEAGKPFAVLVIEGCIFKGTFNVEGTAIGTGTPTPTEKHSGATNIFTSAMTQETLKLAGNAAEISSSTTITMKGGGNPIALTTIT